jgi:hypothetical protein
MYAGVWALKQQAKLWISELLQRFPRLRLSFIVHGDYCDASTSYVIREIPLTRDLADLVNFWSSCTPTGGGDLAECYELVLHRMNQLNWDNQSNTCRQVIMIGDALPHTTADNPEHLDWRYELQKLEEQQVKVHAIQCLYHQSHSEELQFYHELTSQSGGYHFLLYQWIDLVSLITSLLTWELQPNFFNSCQYECTLRFLQQECSSWLKYNLSQLIQNQKEPVEYQVFNRVQIPEPVLGKRCRQDGWDDTRVETYYISKQRPCMPFAYQCLAQYDWTRDTTDEQPTPSTGSMVTRSRLQVMPDQNEDKKEPPLSCLGVDECQSKFDVGACYPTRFQWMILDEDISLSQLKTLRGWLFRKNRAFVRVTEVKSWPPTSPWLLRHRLSGAIFQGKNAQLLLKLWGLTRYNGEMWKTFGWELYVSGIHSLKKLVQGQSFIYEIV